MLPVPKCQEIRARSDVLLHIHPFGVFIDPIFIHRGIASGIDEPPRFKLSCVLVSRVILVD
jgi:hypothetical protein